MAVLQHTTLRRQADAFPFTLTQSGLWHQAAFCRKRGDTSTLRCKQSLRRCVASREIAGDAQKAALRQQASSPGSRPELSRAQIRRSEKSNYDSERVFGDVRKGCSSILRSERTRGSNLGWPLLPKWALALADPFLPRAAWPCRTLMPRAHRRGSNPTVQCLLEPLSSRSVSPSMKPLASSRHPLPKILRR